MKLLSKSLVIDSSTAYLYVALLDEHQVLIEYYKKGNNDHSVKLMEAIEDLFLKTQLTPKDLKQIIVGIGPGSYTGLRIGVVVAKMFAYSLAIPVYSVSSLALLASSVEEDGLIIPAMDARREHAFLGVYLKEGKKITKQSEETYTHLGRFLESIDQAYYHVLKGKPNMETIINSGCLNRVDDVHLLAPLYLRETEAEREQRQKD
jgi:tRNA threonylcarbamoyladenosine biosynthesis protein TsaB